MAAYILRTILFVVTVLHTKFVHVRTIKPEDVKFHHHETFQQTIADHFLLTNLFSVCIGDSFSVDNMCILYFHAKYTRRTKTNPTRTRKRLFQCFLLICGDVEMNPGPIRFPCGIYGKPVAKNQKALQCDICDVWSHMRSQCLNITPEEYLKQGQSDDPWYCPGCLSTKTALQDETRNRIPIVLSNSEQIISSNYTILLHNDLNTEADTTCENYKNLNDSYIPEPGPEEDWMLTPETPITEDQNGNNTDNLLSTESSENEKNMISSMN